METRKMMAFLLALCLLLGVAACGSDEAEPTQVIVPDQTAATELVETEPVETETEPEAEAKTETETEPKLTDCEEPIPAATGCEAPYLAAIGNMLTRLNADNSDDTFGCNSGILYDLDGDGSEELIAVHGMRGEGFSGNAEPVLSIFRMEDGAAVEKLTEVLVHLGGAGGGNYDVGLCNYEGRTCLILHQMYSVSAHTTTKLTVYDPVSLEKLATVSRRESMTESGVDYEFNGQPATEADYKALEDSATAVIFAEYEWENKDRVCSAATLEVLSMVLYERYCGVAVSPIDAGRIYGKALQKLTTGTDDPISEKAMLFDIDHDGTPELFATTLVDLGDGYPESVLNVFVSENGHPVQKINNQPLAPLGSGGSYCCLYLYEGKICLGVKEEYGEFGDSPTNYGTLTIYDPVSFEPVWTSEYQIHFDGTGAVAARTGIEATINGQPADEEAFTAVYDAMILHWGGTISASEGACSGLAMNASVLAGLLSSAALY